MAVDDVAVGSLQAELLQQHIAHRRILIQGVVGVLGLGPGALVLDEPPLKGGHTVPAEDGAVPSGPQPPQEVHAQLALRGAGGVIIGLAGGLLRVVQEVAAGALVPADGKGHQLAVCRHGDAAVKQQIAVVA